MSCNRNKTVNLANLILLGSDAFVCIQMTKMCEIRSVVVKMMSNWIDTAYTVKISKWMFYYHQETIKG